MAGLKNPIGDLLGRLRGGKKSGGAKMHRVRGCADLQGEPPRRGGGEHVVGGSSERRGLTPFSTSSSRLSSIKNMYHKKD